MEEKVLDNIKISIIVPVYNVENYLSRCIESIVHQSYRQFELLLINDGSTDLSGDICDQYALMDKRIKVIHKINEGVSTARNVGIMQARGKYILFIDSDDWVDFSLIHKYIDKIEEAKAELLISEYISEKGNKSLVQPKSIDSGLITIDQAFGKIVNPLGFYGSVWGKLFLRSIIMENHMQFDSNIRIGEDLLFSVTYLQYCHRIIYCNDTLYHYYIRDGSALRDNSNLFDEKRLDIIKVYDEIMKIDRFSEDIYRNRALALYIRECADWYCRMYELKEKEIKNTLRKEVVKNIAPFIRNSIFGIKTKLVTLLKILFPGLMYKWKYKNK